MALKLLLCAILCSTVCLAAGCTGTLPQRKAVERPPTITEEDIKGETSGQPPDQASPAPDAGPSMSQPQPLSGQSPSGDPQQLSSPSERQPRRYKFRDMPGDRKGWEPAGSR